MTRTGQRVWIVYEKSIYGTDEVAHVFNNDSSAKKWVVDNVFGSNEYYTGRTRAENESDALNYIDDFIVED